MPKKPKTLCRKCKRHEPLEGKMTCEICLYKQRKWTKQYAQRKKDGTLNKREGRPLKEATNQELYERLARLQATIKDVQGQLKARGLDPDKPPKEPEPTHIHDNPFTIDESIANLPDFE